MYDKYNNLAGRTQLSRSAVERGSREATGWTFRSRSLQSAVFSSPTASRYVRKVFRAVERLKCYPNSGSRPEELPSTPYREVIVPPCRVFYRADEDVVFILHVMRSERRLRSFLLEHWAYLLSHEGCTMLLEKETYLGRDS